MGRLGPPFRLCPWARPPVSVSPGKPTLPGAQPQPVLVSVNLRPKRMPLPDQRGGGAWLGAQRAKGPVPLYVLSTPALWMSSACGPAVGQSARVPC